MLFLLPQFLLSMAVTYFIYYISQSIFSFKYPHPERGRIFITGSRHLGKHMFILASAYGIARQSNKVPVMSCNVHEHEVFAGSFPNVKRYFTFGEPTGTAIGLNQTGYISYEAKFERLPSGDYYICCYFQSWKYFESYERDISHIFRFNQSLINRANMYLHTLQTRYHKKEIATFVAVDVRQRGGVAEWSATTTDCAATCVNDIHQQWPTSENPMNMYSL